MEYLYDGVWKKWKSLKNAYVYSQIKSQVVTASVAQDCHPVVIPKPVLTQGIPRVDQQPLLLISTNLLAANSNSWVAIARLRGTFLLKIDNLSLKKKSAFHIEIV